jgi:hypothetical protein
VVLPIILLRKPYNQAENLGNEMKMIFYELWNNKTSDDLYQANSIVPPYID